MYVEALVEVARLEGSSARLSSRPSRDQASCGPGHPARKGLLGARAGWCRAIAAESSPPASSTVRKDDRGVPRSRGGCKRSPPPSKRTSPPPGRTPEPRPCRGTQRGRARRAAVTRDRSLPTRDWRPAGGTSAVSIVRPAIMLRRGGGRVPCRDLRRVGGESGPRFFGEAPRHRGAISSRVCPPRRAP